MEVAILFIIMLVFIGMISRQPDVAPPPVIVIQSQPVSDAGSVLLRLIIVVAVLIIIAGIAML